MRNLWIILNKIIKKFTLFGPGISSGFVYLYFLKIEKLGFASYTFLKLGS
jgi:hypothetical protein